MKLKNLIILFISLFCMVTLAAESPPLAMLEQTSDTLITELKKNQSKIKSQPNLVNQIISRIVLPKFNIEDIARATVGQYAKEATPSEWAQFKKQMIGLVIKNYAAPLASFDDDKVKFFPIRGSDSNQVEVKSLIIRKNGQQIPVTYRVMKKNDGWKVLDFSVEGISMVQSYRSQFMPVLSEKGFKGLLNVLGSRG